jgi:small subunit ribosomal protein S4
MAKKRKKSEYAVQLMEKQKAKYSYGILEKQFRRFIQKHHLKVLLVKLLQLCEA